MKRLVLLLAMLITCIGISAQSLEDNVRREWERQRPKHNQPKKGNSDTQAAAVAAKQAAITAQANTAVAKAQQQAQYIEQTYTTEGLKEQYSKKPKASAGNDTATISTNKHKTTSGTNAKLSANAAKKKGAKQGQWGTIGGNGNSYIPTYKNAKQFKSTIRPKVQQRKPRFPAGICPGNKPKTMTAQMTIKPMYPTRPQNDFPKNPNRPTDRDRNRPTDRPAKQPKSNPRHTPYPENPYPENHPTLPTKKVPDTRNNNRPDLQPGVFVTTQSSGFGKAPNRPIEKVPKSSEIRKGMTGGTLAMNMAVTKRNMENIYNGMQDGWKSDKTAFKKTLYARPIGGNCVILDDGRCVKR